MNQNIARFGDFNEFIEAVKKATAEGYRFCDCGVSTGNNKTGGRMPRHYNAETCFRMSLHGESAEGLSLEILFESSEGVPYRQSVLAVEAIPGVYFNDTTYSKHCPWNGEKSEGYTSDPNEFRNKLELLKNEGAEFLRIILLRASAPNWVEDPEVRKGYANSMTKGLIVYVSVQDEVGCLRTEFDDNKAAQWVEDWLKSFGEFEKF